MRYNICWAIAIAVGTALSASSADAKCVNCPLIVPFTVGPDFTGTVGPPGVDGPPDTMGAVGPTAVVELNNLQLSVYDKLGLSALQRTPLNDFWIAAGVAPLGGGAFDPRILYDKQSGRWIAAAVDGFAANPVNNGPNNILVAVSNTSDPRGAWTGQRIPVNAPGRARSGRTSLGSASPRTG